MNIRLILISFFIFLSSAVYSQVEISLNQPINKNFVESELISEISFIETKNDKMNRTLSDLELKIDEQDYFILDSRLTQMVYHFDENGELLNTITTQKTIEGTTTTPVLNNPVKFNINPTLKQVEIFSFENSSLNRFSYSGKKIDQIVLPIDPSDFIRDNKNNYWIYTGWNSKNSKYFRLIHADQNGNVIDRRMRLPTKCTPIESFAFSRNKNAIYLWELLGDTTYRIENNKTVATFYFNYGKKNLPDQFHSMNSYDSYQMINRNGYYSIKKYLENENFAYFFLNFISESQKVLFHIIYDKINKKLYRYSEDAALAFDKALELTKDDELVFLASPRNIKRMAISETVTLPQYFDPLVEACDSIRNIMIVKIKLAAPSTTIN